MRTPIEKQIAAYAKLNKALTAVLIAVPELKTINVRFYKRGPKTKQTKYSYFQQP